MSVKNYNPTSPGRRISSVADFSILTKKKPEKNLTVGKKSSGGRAQGKITVRHRGGGHKRKLRILDWYSSPTKQTVTAKVIAIEYDPNRSAYIALIATERGEKKYILAPEGLQMDQKIYVSQDTIDIAVGNRAPLGNIPAGSVIHNIELFPGQGGKVVRSAGTLATLLSLEGEYAHVRLPSGEVRIFAKDCTATIGQVSNTDHRHVRRGKAGRMRWLGIRPTVRGKAMKPVDHPHGGGEGGSPIGMKRPKTPTGKPALGVKTRKQHKKSNRFILKPRARKVS